MVTGESNAPWATTADSNMMVLGPISGSKPDWKGANIKCKGKASTEFVPASLLGETGWEKWTFLKDPKAGFGKRHYHESPLTQATARSCLPCVDPMAICSSSTSSNLRLSCSLAAALAEQRRHRRMIHTPPAKHRPEGKRILPRLPPECSALFQEAPAAVQQQQGQPKLQQQPLAQQQADPPSNSSSASAVPTAGTYRSAHPPACSATVAHPLPGTTPTAIAALLFNATAPASAAAARIPEIAAVPAAASTATTRQLQVPFRQAGSAASQLGSNSSSSSRQHDGVQCTVQLQALQALQPAGNLSNGRTGLAPRVQDNPNYFRTLKDPPAFQRFYDSMKPPQPQPGSLCTAARHQAAIGMRQRQAEALARKEVAALQAAEQ